MVPTKLGGRGRSFADRKNPKTTKSAWRTEPNYLTDNTYLPVTNPALWKPINFIRRNRALYNIVKHLTSIKRNGIQELARLIKANMRITLPTLEMETHLAKHGRVSQENTTFPTPIKITIITPLNNTPKQYLKEMIESVLAQTYGNWELCLADQSDKEHEYVGHMGSAYAQNDQRIKYVKIENNHGRSALLNNAIKKSSGEYIGILDHIDILHPSALYEVMKAIYKDGAEFIYTDEAVFSPNRTIILKHHKPDYAFDTLCSCNYISRFTVFSKKLTDHAGMFRSEFDGSHDYDLILRYTEAASHVCHISKLLYFRRSHDRANEPRFNNEPYAVWSAEKAIGDYLKKRGFTARVEKKFGFPGFYRVNFILTEKPLVSIIIPNKDNIALLRNCLSSIIEKTTYENYEIIIVENNSTKDATFEYYEELKRYPGITVLNWEGKGFNYSELCNFGARYSAGKQLLFMNNDVEIITPNWIEEMLMYSQRKDVGVVGMKLYFLNGSVQHAGMVLGMGGVPSHVYLGMPYTEMGFMAKLHIVQNMSAVTAACMMIRRSVFEEVGLFAPEFCSSYNDVDLCLKTRKAGYLIVWTPYAEAYHLESKSRGYNTTSGQKRKHSQETALFKAKWKEVLAQGDPYYNRNFSTEKTEYGVR
jgi:GT2 family glycosyltransferase